MTRISFGGIEQQQEFKKWLEALPKIDRAEIKKITAMADQEIPTHPIFAPLATMETRPHVQHAATAAAKSPGLKILYANLQEWYVERYNLLNLLVKPNRTDRNALKALLRAVQEKIVDMGIAIRAIAASINTDGSKKDD